MSMSIDLQRIHNNATGMDHIRSYPAVSCRSQKLNPVFFLTHKQAKKDPDQQRHFSFLVFYTITSLVFPTWRLEQTTT